MPKLDPEHFDDPSLRQAVRRAWGRERAPESLRGRIRQMIWPSAVTDHNGAADRNGRHQSDSIERLGEPAIQCAADAPRCARFATCFGWHNYAAAALLLLCVGIIGYQIHSFYREFRPRPTRFVAASILPPSSVSQLVFKHDDCAALPDHHDLDAPRTSFAGIARSLRQQLGCEILSADLSQQGWRFDGASVCWVGGAQASHLLYVRDDATLSLFTLPASPCGGTLPGTREHSILDDHYVAAFQKDGALHAIVLHAPAGEPDAQMASAIDLRDQLRRTMHRATKLK